MNLLLIISHVVFLATTMALQIDGTANAPQVIETTHDESNYTKMLIKRRVNLGERRMTAQSAPPTFQDFIRQSNFWVDTSKFIEEIWNDCEWLIYIITAPRRWCKTTNLSMFGFYCQLPLDEYGTKMSLTDSPNYKYFAKGEIVHKNGVTQRTTELPLISTYSGNQLHLGKYPVIEMTGRGLSLYCEDLKCFRDMIGEAFNKHRSLYTYLTSVSQKGPVECRAKAYSNLKTFNIFCDADSMKTVSEYDLAVSIKILSKLLNDTYGNRVIILYDEYDSFYRKPPFTSKDRFNDSCGAEFTNFLSNFMQVTFKENPHLDKAIITGELPVKQLPDYLGLNDTKSIHVVDKHQNLFPYYGIFTKEFDDVKPAPVA